MLVVDKFKRGGLSADCGHRWTQIKDQMSLLHLKADFLSELIASPGQLTQRLCHALTSFLTDRENVAPSVRF